MSLDLSAPLLAAVTGTAAITDLLGSYNSAPSIHTRRPVPADAEFPMVIISPSIALTDEDGINDRRPRALRDISVYGEAEAHYRDVETISYLIRELFHRNEGAITVADYSVIDIITTGPRIAPADDDTQIGRVVSLTIRLAKKL